MKLTLGIQKPDLTYIIKTIDFADQKHYQNYCKVVRINGGKIVHESEPEISGDLNTIAPQRKGKTYMQGKKIFDR